MEYIGKCIYCGQTKMVVCGDNLTEEEIDKLATLECGCDEAKVFQKIEEKKTYAETNIKSLFSEDGCMLVPCLLKVVHAVATQNIKKVSITTADGIKASLIAKENSIKVERTEVKKSSLED